MFTTRVVAIDELQTVHDLAHATWPTAYGKILSPEQLRYMLEKIYNVDSLITQAKTGHHFFLALQNNTPIGFASFSSVSPDRYRLHKLYVLPGSQGTGAGKFLLDFVIANARDAGASYLELNVNRHNKALEFYKRNGFRIAREEDIDIGEGFFMNDYVMELDL